jgi:hypothetical protein
MLSNPERVYLPDDTSDDTRLGSVEVGLVGRQLK